MPVYWWAPISLSTQSSIQLPEGGYLGSYFTTANVRNRLHRKGINSKDVQQARKIEDQDSVVGPIAPEKTEKTETPVKEPKDVPNNPKAEFKPAKAKTDTEITTMEKQQQQ
ncbi:hypothetical protein AbraIFM66950_003429 [Aspergillus brasiliensis]|nr:hypothetical protein AbraIFM66950_003429 [Aspergillus brasiliensis]